MPAIDLIEQYAAALRAQGGTRQSLTSTVGTLTRADRAPEIPYGLDAACKDEIEAWIGRVDLAPNTRAAYYARLKGFYDWAVRTNRLAYDPTSGMRAPRGVTCLPRPVDDEVLADILVRANDKLFLACLLAAGGGLRCCEIAPLRREDVSQQSIYIRRGKGGKPGIVDAHPIVWKHIAPMPPGRLLDHVNGPKTAEAVSNLGSRGMARLGHPGIGLHALRHWYGTGVFEEAGDILTAASALRHASVSTAQVYTLLRNRRRRDAVHALPVLGSIPPRALGA